MPDVALTRSKPLEAIVVVVVVVCVHDGEWYWWVLCHDSVW